MTYQRYGIYMVPTGDLYTKGAAWLGWDSVTGAKVPQPDIGELPVPTAELTARPRKYGLHATMKPPFRLAEGRSEAALATALDAFCATRASLTLPRIALRRLGRFLAIVAPDPPGSLADLAAGTVRTLDRFRAPPGNEELARRRARGLSAQQDRLLAAWGYPFVMEAFRFHITLTGPLDDATAAATQQALEGYFGAVLDDPLPIESLSLVGEAADGAFHLIRRYRLRG